MGCVCVCLVKRRDRTNNSINIKSRNVKEIGTKTARRHRQRDSFAHFSSNNRPPPSQLFHHPPNINVLMTVLPAHPHGSERQYTRARCRRRRRSLRIVFLVIFKCVHMVWWSSAVSWLLYRTDFYRDYLKKYINLMNERGLNVFNTN